MLWATAPTVEAVPLPWQFFEHATLVCTRKMEGARFAFVSPEYAHHATTFPNQTKTLAAAQRQVVWVWLAKGRVVGSWC